jgi:sulfur-carrier protein
MNASVPSAITVRVALFARYAELFGTGALSVALPTGATVGDLTTALRRLPGGDKLPARPLCAVNLHQASESTVLSVDDEIALLPPIAGG